MAKKKARKKASPKKRPAKRPAKRKAKRSTKSAAQRKPARKAKATAKRKPARKAKAVGKAKTAPTTLLQVGQVAPNFALPNENGEIVRLSDLRGKPVVLYFYPKDDTPGCTQESCDFRDNYARVKAKGAEVFGISKDNEQSHTRFKAKYSLPFSLLADTEGHALQAYGVWKEKNNYGRKYMGIERTTVIIDAEGRIQRIYPRVSVKGHVDQVLEDLR